MSPYREIGHTADWALEIQARDMTDLLATAANGMLHLMELHPPEVPGEIIQIELECPDRESLLVEWLQELLYLIESKEVGIGRMDIAVENETHLVADIEQIPGAHLTKEIKAVTYHGLRIDETESGLKATVVFDV
jgi:SHS2 domain-containing protein